MTDRDIEARKDKWFAKFPRWDLKQCRLREVRSEDTPEYHCYILHPEVKMFVPVDCHSDSLEWCEDHLKFSRSQFIHRSGFYWTIADKKNRQDDRIYRNDKAKAPAKKSCIQLRS